MIHPMIMCGGSGTRLWPASRESMPKQFIPLLGEASTFQETGRRVADPAHFAKPIIITGANFRFTVAEQLLEAGLAADIVLEPLRRDSAAAIAAGALLAAKRDPEAVVLALAADHFVRDGAGFRDACLAAAEGARKGFIMTLGVKPTRPATSYGYIKPGAPIAGTDTFKVERFVEKPSADVAERLIADGCLWNSGNFLFRADVMIAELEKAVPEILAAVRESVEKAVVDLDFIRLNEAAFARSPKTSIDYAVMEQTQLAGVLPTEVDWSDVGTWGALWDLSERDERGNFVSGRVTAIDTNSSFIQSNDLVTGVVGLDNVVVVTTRDAVLVASRDRSDQVKELVAELQRKNEEEADSHLRIHRPWGWYQRVEIGPRFQVKRIMVKPGQRLSLQKHFHRAEHWVVVHGTGEVTVDDRVILMQENEAAYLPLGSVHRLANPGRIPLEIIEVQVGSYTGEDDIVRFEDVYGRTGGDTPVAA